MSVKPLDNISSKLNLSTVSLGIFDCFQVTVHSNLHDRVIPVLSIYKKNYLAVHGSIQSSVIQGVSHAGHDGCVGLLQLLQNLVVQVLMYDQSPEGGATLAGCTHSSKHSAGDHLELKAKLTHIPSFLSTDSPS